MDLQLADRARRRAAAAIEDPPFDHFERRFGRIQTRQRLGIEEDHENRARRRAGDVSGGKRWFLNASIIRTTLKFSGLYWRARKNAERIKIRHHDIVSDKLPTAFDGFTILQISDLHVDMNEGAINRLIELLPTLSYDACVLTGDYRGKTFGPFEATLEGLARTCAKLEGPVYGVLGNHDTIRMVPAMEAMGIQMLLNESEELVRGGERIYLAGIDDAHFYKLDDIAKAAAHVPSTEFSILLSHTPEIYRQAAHAGFKLMLSGHTHGGQICLPGVIPITLCPSLPRRMGAGSWRYNDMVGYTSVGVGSSIVPARINCPPEITLHRLQYARY